MHQGSLNADRQFTRSSFSALRCENHVVVSTRLWWHAALGQCRQQQRYCVMLFFFTYTWHFCKWCRRIAHTGFYVSMLSPLIAHFWHWIPVLPEITRPFRGIYLRFMPRDFCYKEETTCNRELHFKNNQIWIYCDLMALSILFLYVPISTFN